MSQVTFISGAGRGIGRAIAIRLAQDGFDVAINDIPASKRALEETAAEIKEIGRKPTAALYLISTLKQYTEIPDRKEGLRRPSRYIKIRGDRKCD